MGIQHDDFDNEPSGFGDWLREQTDRDDVIGDLAKDFTASGDTSIEWQRLGDGASRAYERALNEYAAVSVFST